jgi:hypothetical protein
MLRLFKASLMYSVAVDIYTRIYDCICKDFLRIQTSMGCRQ